MSLSKLVKPATKVLFAWKIIGSDGVPSRLSWTPRTVGRSKPGVST